MRFIAVSEGAEGPLAGVARSMAIRLSVSLGQGGQTGTCEEREARSRPTRGSEQSRGHWQTQAASFCAGLSAAGRDGMVGGVLACERAWWMAEASGRPGRGRRRRTL